MRRRRPAGKIDAGKVVELSAFAFLLVVSVAATSQLGGLSAIVVVAMASLVFPIAWMAAIGRLPTYAREFRGDYFNNKLPQSKNQIVLFAGAGFFAQSIGYSHLGDALVGSLLHMTGQSVLLLTVAIIGITLATSAVGTTPLAVVAVGGRDRWSFSMGRFAHLPRSCFVDQLGDGECALPCVCECRGRFRHGRAIADQGQPTVERSVRAGCDRGARARAHHGEDGWIAVAAIAIAPSWKCIETADQRLDIGGFGRGLPLTYKCPYDFKVRY